MVTLFTIIAASLIGTGVIVATTLSGTAPQAIPIALGVTGVSLLTLLPFYRSLVVPARRRKQLLKMGRQATATILSARDTGVSVNDNPQAMLLLQVHPHEGTSFQVHARTLVPRLQTYLIQPGRQVTVAYDPQAPTTRVEIIALTAAQPHGLPAGDRGDQGDRGDRGDRGDQEGALVPRGAAV